MSRPGSKSKSAAAAAAASTWRTAPDNFSYQKNQKFNIRDVAEPSPAQAAAGGGEKLLRPVFVAKDVHLAGEKRKAPANNTAAAAVAPVLSSRTMKASAPISRAPVEVIDAGGLLKKFDEDAIGQSNGGGGGAGWHLFDIRWAR